MDPTFLIVLALALGAMFLMTNRTRKQQKEAANFRANLAPGQEVMTGSGLFGTIVAVEDDVITLETSPGVTSRWLRPAIAKLVEAPVTETDDVLDEHGGEERLGDHPQVPDDASGLTRRDEDDTQR